MLDPPRVMTRQEHRQGRGRKQAEVGQIPSKDESVIAVVRQIEQAHIHPRADDIGRDQRPPREDCRDTATAMMTCATANNRHQAAVHGFRPVELFDFRVRPEHGPRPLSMPDRILPRRIGTGSVSSISYPGKTGAGVPRTRRCDANQYPRIRPRDGYLTPTSTFADDGKVMDGCTANAPG